MREDKSISLVLLNGSLSRLERGDVPEILEIRDQLSVVEEYAELEMGGFGVCNPSPKFLQRLRFSVAQRDPSHIADILRAGLDRECLTLDGSASGPRPVPTSYAEAVATLMASADSDVDLDRKENWKAVQEWLQKDLIDPLTKEAEETLDALRRNQLVIAAGLNSLAHTQLLSLAIAAAAPGGSHGPTGPRGIPDEELKQLLRLVDRARNVTKDIQSWRTQSKSKLGRWRRGRRAGRLRRTRRRCPRPQQRPNALSRARARLRRRRRLKATGVRQPRGAAAGGGSSTSCGFGWIVASGSCASARMTSWHDASKRR